MTSTQVKHCCHICQRTYERADHLRRHLSSHDNARSYRCTICEKGFNRADLLLRHQANHEKNDASLRSGQQRIRTTQACKACAAARARCDQEKPCRRCHAKNLLCLAAESLSSTISTSNCKEIGNEPRAVATETSLTDAQSLEDNVGVDAVTSQTSFEAVNVSSFPFDSLTQLWSTNASYTDGPFFTNTVPLGLADIDFSTMDDTTFHSFLEDSTAAPEPTIHCAPNSETDAPKTKCSSAQGRSDAFRRQIWANWCPSKTSHCFAGQDVLDAQDISVDEELTVISSSSPDNISTGELNERGRDAMLQVVLGLKAASLKVPCFPPLSLLQKLTQAFFLREQEAIATDIHMESFVISETSPELMLAIVAAGAIAIPISNVQQVGLVLQEVARLAIAQALEDDNSKTRDLQTLQAYALQNIIGAWSGIQRKAEIASSFVAQLVAMLRHAMDASAAGFNSSIAPELLSSLDRDARWREWIDRESVKRLAIRTLIHDTQVCMSYDRPPMMSYARMSFTVPCRAELWSLSTATDWSSEMSRVPPGPDVLLTEVFANPTIMSKYECTTDVRLCCLALAHAIAQKVLDFRQQSDLLDLLQGPARAVQEAWCHARQRIIYSDLLASRTYQRHRAADVETAFMLEYAMMSLHVSVRDIERFAGKNGVAEARKSHSILKAWVTESTARTAVWHAGQVLRVARTFPTFKLRGFYAIGVYHAALTLWCYSCVTHSDLDSGLSTPRLNTSQPTRDLTTWPQIILNGPESEAVQAFVLLGDGVPGLTDALPSQTTEAPQPSDLYTFRDLKTPALALNIACEIPRRNTAPDFCMPLLVRNLVGWMTDLAALPAP